MILIVFLTTCWIGNAAPPLLVESARQQESGPALQSLLSFTQTYPLWGTMHPGRIAYSGRMRLARLRHAST